MNLPDITNMKALSIRQPWCEHILRDGKDVENRNWPTKYRGQFLIHASKTFDGPKSDSKGFDMGGIVGIAEIVDCVSESDSKWFMGEYGFVLRNPIALPSMIPCKGALGFFTPNQFDLGWTIMEMVDDGDLTMEQIIQLFASRDVEEMLCGKEGRI